jgi:replication factor C subunit 1
MYSDHICRTSANEKDAIMSPWVLMGKLFAPQTWSQMSSMSFIDKCNLYFHDHDMLPLFVQVCGTEQYMVI